MTRFMRPGPESPGFPALVSEAATAALADARIEYDEVEQVVASNGFGTTTSGQRAIYSLGLTGVPVVNVTNACASGSTALVLARQLIAGGIASCVLVVGFERMTVGSLQVDEADPDYPLAPHLATLAESRGTTMDPMAAQLFGAAGREHMERFGSTAEHFAAVGAKNHRHSVHNPRAQFQRDFTIDEVLASRPVFDPLTLLQCSPTSDGAAAAILMSEAMVIERGLGGQAVEVLAQALTSDVSGAFDGSMIELVGAGMTRRAAELVYETSGRGPEDVDVIELHDCFSTNEVITYEALGLCPEGKGGELAISGATTYGGDWVVNPSGGLISKGHPIGATGVAQCAELCWQLRGEAGDRQVEGARLALQHNLGLGGAVVVTMYGGVRGADPS